MSGEQQGLIDELRRRFPLFDRIVGQFGENTHDERIPWFFALLLAAASNAFPGACCFVLDKTVGTTAVAAVLLAFVRLQEDFPQLVKSYARTALSKGQRVKVKPSDFVYEYDGLWDGYPGFFRLKVMGDEEYRTFPMAEVLRLEPTDRVRPKGALNSKLGVFERSHLDELLDLTTCGNNSLIRNTVLLYTAQARFAEVVDTIALAPEHASGVDRLSYFLPWGSIGQDGSLKPNDNYQVAGEPIIGVTRVPEDLALASLSVPPASKVVLVDGARGFARDFQAFDDIADRQRTVILASPDETEALDLLKDRGCPVWHMSPAEILIGEASERSRVRASLVGRTIRAADTRYRVRVTLVECHDRVLQEVAASLERAAEKLANDDEVHESEEILARLFGILFECSECCFGVSEETRDNLHSVRNKVKRHRNWLDQEIIKNLQDAICGLEYVVTDESCGREKADAMLKLIHETRHQSWTVATRSPRTTTALLRGFKTRGVEIDVLPVPAVSSDGDYAGIIVPAWPNDRRFSRLKNQAVTHDIRVLTYPFETKWVRRHQARESARERSNRMEIETRSAILGIGTRMLTTLTSHEPDSPVYNVPRDVPIFRIEDRITRHHIMRPSVAVEGEDSREAHLVQFFGDCHALLTEWAALPRLNHLIDQTTVNEATLPTVTASQLSPGDYVLFRASGDKEFIRLIAESQLGEEEYERIRSVAERWKISLRRLGTSPSDVQRRLAAAGLERAVVTVAGWLGNKDRIGPRSLHDIETIARVTEDVELLSIRKDVENAIARIRGAHIAAGGQLTRLILGELGGRLQLLDDQPVLLNLDYGTAWVVQVNVVAMIRRNYPSDMVNRLLWVDDTAF